MRTLLALALTAVSGMLSSQALAAQANSSGPWSIRLYEENDSPWPGSTDEHYTQGLKLEYGHETPRLGFGKRAFPGRSACPREESVRYACYRERVRVSLGQNMYTPRSLAETEQIIGDRPYGGWLYLEGRVEAATPSDRSGFGRGLGKQWGAGISVGVVGPSSLADTIQRWWHRRPFIAAERPNGWSHQISDRPALMLIGEYKQRFLDFGSQVVQAPRRVRILDAFAEGGASVGNVLTSARAGTTVRLGFNLPNDFGPAYITPAPPPPPMPSSEAALHAAPPSAAEVPRNPLPVSRRFSAFAFAGAEGRHVLYNVFIDAEADHYEISRRPWVADLSWGFGLRYCALSFTYRRVTRTAEYRPDDIQHRFDAFSLGYSRAPCRQ